MKLRYLAICILAVVPCTIANAQQENVAVPGTITRVTAGTDLTGGGASGNVTLNLDTTKVPQLKKANTFTGNQTVTGNVSASGTVSGASYQIGGTPFAFGSAASENAFLGFAGNSSTTTTGTQNTAVGNASLYYTTSGFGNTAVGSFSLLSTTTGATNTAVGSNAMLTNNSGTYNTAVGELGLYSNTTGDGNVAIGGGSLYYNTTGTANAALGANSAQNNLTGSYNTFLGFGTNTTTTNPVSNATAIGANATVGESNAMILGGTTFSAVSVGIGTATPYTDYGLDVETVNSNGIINGGVVVNASGGNLYLGMTSTVHKFRVDTNGAVYADGGLFANGADFAESVEVRGDRAQYEPGDVLAIDRSADRHLALSHHSYETLVAGIYSTKPGVLASPHHIDDPSIQTSEVPLAVVGIVPCKVTAENGAIQRGDLLVTSSRPGYAMKGTDRKRLVGAVVGKALEPLSAGTGTIQILVTLQ
jgi:hypothetical protein